MTTSGVHHRRRWTALGATAAALTALGCERGAPDAATAVTFNRDVAPIVFRDCVPCHRPGASAPFPLLGYEDVRRRARQIRDVTADGYMPPWLPSPESVGLAHERRLSPEEIELIARWVEGGMIEGAPDDLPAPPRFAEGWQLGEPDIVVRMTEPYELVAEGRDVFRNFVIPVPVDRTRHVQAVELRPGNPRIVHHAVILVDAGRSSSRLDALDDEPGFDGMDLREAVSPDGHFLGWTPGRVPDAGVAGLAWRLDPGTDIVLQLHLRPTGKPEVIQSEIGLFLADAPPTRQLFHLSLRNDFIDIAAGEGAYVIEDRYELPVDVDVLSVYPHAHYLGKRMEISATRPDGTVDRLLQIDDWDFNWQDFYRLADPLSMPRGTILSMRYTYDNTAGNVRNPSSPPRRVVHGPESTDEMGTAGIQVLPRTAADLATLADDKRRSDRRRDIAFWERLRERNAANVTILDALGVLYRLEGRHAEAVGCFEEALRREPANADVLSHLGAALQAAGRLGEALATHRRAVAAEPAHAEAHHNLAETLVAFGDRAQAIEHYRRALELDPFVATTHYNLATALQAMGRSDEAIEHYRRTLRIRPGHARAHYNLGVVLGSRGVVEEALVHFREAVRLEPADARAQHNLAVALERTGDLDGAIEHYRAAVAIEPGYEQARRNLERAVGLQRGPG